MKFIAFETDHQQYWGVLKGDHIDYYPKLVELFPTLLSVIQGFQFVDFQNEIKHSISVDEVNVRAPYIPEKNIISVGKNYREHAIEMDENRDEKAVPKDPVIFSKSPTSIIANGETVEPHEAITSELDYEGELAVIIGKQGVNFSEEEALDYVFGYTILNDISARDLQKRHKQFFRAKSLDTFGPMGPVIVTKDELAQPDNLSIRTFVNEEMRQDGNTKDMIFHVPYLLSLLSTGMTLYPGDIITTGTPSGVGKGYKPPKFLKKGDKVRVEIEGIGALENPIGEQ
ncbi:fumarylacetoacetate hydrolase family protein [Allobacillus halotolerans]|uniref:Fumarylacetoacetate hydrolase family protein n=1 Tax=Allobacillus halotolerans TaxID=570278 RepID=A0ABS6GS07_9BACI|nr:fumarylacetoacetate hydrolase family protein [Allobacillus halotolerans]MBU6081912.1 fumarylacetoacetate hydrolase family protein [Allobacillus halotolerans]